MIQLLLWVGGWLIETILSVVVAKAFAAVFLFVGIQLMITYLFGMDILPEWMTVEGLLNLKNAIKSGINTGLNQATTVSQHVSFKEEFLYLWNYFKVEYILATRANASLTRFLIRRIFK